MNPDYNSKYLDIISELELFPVLKHSYVAGYMDQIKDLGVANFTIFLIQNTSSTFYMDILICMSHLFGDLDESHFSYIFEHLESKFFRISFIIYFTQFLNLDYKQLLQISNIDSGQKNAIDTFFTNNQFLLDPPIGNNFLSVEVSGITPDYLKEVTNQILNATTFEEYSKSKV